MLLQKLVKGQSPLKRQKVETTVSVLSLLTDIYL